MPAMLERTVTIDRNLVRRAERKLHRYGTSFDDMVSAALKLVVSTRGMPEVIVSVQPMGAFATHDRRMKPQYSPAQKMRRPGGLTGEFWMADDFDDTPAEVIDDFENAMV